MRKRDSKSRLLDFSGTRRWEGEIPHLVFSTSRIREGEKVRFQFSSSRLLRYEMVTRRFFTNSPSRPVLDEKAGRRDVQTRRGALYSTRRRLVRGNPRYSWGPLFIRTTINNLRKGSLFVWTAFREVEKTIFGISLSHLLVLEKSRTRDLESRFLTFLYLRSREDEIWNLAFSPSRIREVEKTRFGISPSRLLGSKKAEKTKYRITLFSFSDQKSREDEELSRHLGGTFKLPYWGRPEH